jgi:threonyl-tRNA synthetase
MPWTAYSKHIRIQPEHVHLCLAGAYWRGDEKYKMLPRYCVAFATKEELDSYIKTIEEAEKRDHRKLGKELNLFIQMMRLDRASVVAPEGRAFVGLLKSFG